MSGRTASHIAVLMGGPSSEREVSLVTGRKCSAALRGEGYEVTEIDAGADLAQRLADIAPDAAFNALHGRWGEDGCVQGILEWLRIPYTHSGVAPSSMAMDKDITKKLVYGAAGLPTAAFRIITPADLVTGHPLEPPYVVKPVSEGSSVGVAIVSEEDCPPENFAGCRYGRLMAETYIPGRELTVTVFQEQALAVTEIISEGWYDYSAKYMPGGSRHVLPAEIPADIYEFCMECALAAHRELGCRGISRTDFRWNDRLGTEGLGLLETNTQPGMTPTSLSPEQAAHCGIPFSQLCRQLVEDASCQR